jgi:hypothetical protein
MARETFRKIRKNGSGGRFAVVKRADLESNSRWTAAFRDFRKDHRYYELVEDTICPDLDFRYFIFTNNRGEICAVQPFFILNQDILAGVHGRAIKTLARFVRRGWPGFLRMRTLMVGCAAGEGHLDGADDMSRWQNARLLVGALERHAREANASLVVLKEFPPEYRATLSCFLERGYARVPSLPMVSLRLDYADFDDYLQRAVSRKMRADLRRNLRAAARAAPIDMTVIADATPIVDELYPLYLQVYERSTLRFEKLTRDYMSRIGRAMPDKVRFFVWRQCGRAVAFSLSMVHGDTISNEYLGLDYRVALELHLYFYIFRDIMNWAIAHGYRRCLSSSLNYEPKRHLRFQLSPLDLYVRHTSHIPNILLRGFLPLLEPTRYDRTLRRFANFSELWGGDPPARTAFFG